MKKDRVLYVISYSHLDTEWCWTYRNSIMEYIPNTLSQNFALIDQYPDYVFNWTGADRYRFMRDYYPDEFARLKQYVAAGRWVPTGSAWDEADADVPSSESLIRQILYGNEFFKQEFGKTSNQYMMPDTFGFPASLPTILAHSGLKGFSTKKLTYGAGAAAGVPFNVGRWIGLDGQSVIAALNPGDYRTKVTEDLSHSATWMTRLDDDGQRSGLFVDYMYHGNGDQGGSPGAQSVGWLEKSLAGDGPIHVVSGSADDMFTAITPELAASLPQYKGDLLLIQHSAGSINSGAAMKRWNHRNERLADSAERVSVAAALLTPGSYPAGRIRDSWERFLGGQMHDIITGTSIPSAYEFAWNDEVVAMNQFADVTLQGVDTVARGLDTRVPAGSTGIPLVIYNPLSIMREDVAEAVVALPKGRGVQVLGPDGKEIPAQIVGSAGEGKVRVIFSARVPSVGFATYIIRPIASVVKSTASALSVTKQGLENARYRVKLDVNGDIASVYDKLAKREILSGPARLAFQYEKPQKHPAWNMDWEDRQKPPVGYVDGPANISIVENGPVRVALRIERTARGSKFAQIVRLSTGATGDRVEFLNDIDWHSTESSLKAVFPMGVSNPLATYNWEVGTIQRGNNDPKKYEVPSHEWFDLTDTSGSYGVSVLNEAKYGSDKPDDRTLRLTLLYTPGVGDAYKYQGSQDWGHHEIRYALEGHTGDWRQGRSFDQSARLNQPLVVVPTTPHAGALGRSFSLVQVNTPQVAVAALKKAEGSDEIIVRLFERNGSQIKDARLAFASPIASIREVDGQEQGISPQGKAALSDGKLVFDMEPYRPRAFAVTLGKAPAQLASVADVPLVLPFNADVTSSGKGQHDGDFDGTGRTIPAELLPKSLNSGGVHFELGASQGTEKNAVTCSGQTIALSEAKGTGTRRVYLLAAASGEDTPAAFQVGDKSVTLNIQNWGGYIGQWDTRLWNNADTYDTCIGVKPGFIKRDPVAWYSDHWRLADGTNDAYRFCYLFRYAIDIPAGAKTLTLPNSPSIHIMAATVRSNADVDTEDTTALYN